MDGTQHKRKRGTFGDVFSRVKRAFTAPAGNDITNWVSAAPLRALVMVRCVKWGFHGTNSGRLRG